MALTGVELDEWVNAYIEAQLLADDVLTHEHPLWWSVARGMHLPDRETAEDAWAVILAVLRRTQDEEVLGVPQM